MPAQLPEGECDVFLRVRAEPCPGGGPYQALPEKKWARHKYRQSLVLKTGVDQFCYAQIQEGKRDVLLQVRAFPF